MAEEIKENAKKDAPKKKRARRKQRPFPASTFEESLDFAKKIHGIASGQPVRRITLFDELGKSPESSASRQLIINAGRYGITKGGIQAENIELTDLGRKCADEQVTPRERLRARIQAAVLEIDPFAKVFDRFEGNKLPAHSVLQDAFKEFEVDEEYLSEAVDLFIVNLRFVGLLKTLSGAERIISVDMRLDEVPSSSERNYSPSSGYEPGQTLDERGSTQIITSGQAQYEATCFFIAPIGEEGSEARKHSDMFLSSFVEPAVEEFGLNVVRADAIDKPGIITRQIIEYVMRSRIVIADLSYHNPNVFYELALRHALKKPIVQIARLSDKIPFDINQMRTILIDTTDIYTLLPKVESYRSEISAQVRRALESDHVVDTPISIYFPNLQIQFE